MNLTKDNIKNTCQHGFTLIEIILTLSIIALIAVSFIPFLTNSFSGIMAVGNRANSLYEAQAEIESLFDSSSDGTSSSVDIVCDSPSKTFTIEGRLKEVNKTVNGSSLHLYIFVPD